MVGPEECERNPLTFKTYCPRDLLKCLIICNSVYFLDSHKLQLFSHSPFKKSILGKFAFGFSLSASACTVSINFLARSRSAVVKINKIHLDHLYCAICALELTLARHA